MFTVRGKVLVVGRHGHEGLSSERARISIADIVTVLEEPDGEANEGGSRRRAWSWLGSRTVLVTYVEDEWQIQVIAVSATHRKI